MGFLDQVSFFCKKAFLISAGISNQLLDGLRQRYYRIATNAATTGIEIMESRVEMQIPFETRVTSRLYSIQSMDTFPAIGQPERIVEISNNVRSLIKNLRTKNGDHRENQEFQEGEEI